jgi:hypothetical protein
MRWKITIIISLALATNILLEEENREIIRMALNSWSFHEHKRENRNVIWALHKTILMLYLEKKVVSPLLRMSCFKMMGVERSSDCTGPATLKTTSHRMKLDWWFISLLKLWWSPSLRYGNGGILEPFYFPVGVRTSFPSKVL